MKRRYQYTIILILLILLVLLFFYWTRPINYLDPSSPVYVEEPIIVCDSTSYDHIDLTIISYNVQHGEKIDEAMDVLLSIPVVGNRVYLLQEMHPDAVAYIADALGMYSIYYPLNRGYFSNQDFGNAILASTPLYEFEKVIFPHGQFHNDRRRGMTLALTCLGGRVMLLGSIHSATVFMEQEKREEQIEYVTELLNEYQGLADISIVGGDFNAISTTFTSFIADQFKSIGYEYATVGLGVTHQTSIPMLDSELDLIFCDNCNVAAQGILDDNSASDHYPVWIQITEVSP